MKFTTFVPSKEKDGGRMLGVILDENSILNLHPAAALYMKEIEKEKRPYLRASQFIPADMAAFLEQGGEAMNLARRTIDFILPLWQQEKKKAGKGLRRETLVFPLSGIRRKPPVSSFAHHFTTALCVYPKCLATFRVDHPFCFTMYTASRLTRGSAGFVVYAMYTIFAGGVVPSY